MSDLLYLKIYKTIKAAILEGTLAPGDRIDGVRELSSRWNASSNTILRALDLLEKDRLVARNRGRGIFIAPVSEWKISVPHKERVALYVYELDAPRNIRIIREIERRCSEKGFELIVSSLVPNAVSEQTFENISAIIVIPGGSEDEIKRVAGSAGGQKYVIFTGDFSPPETFSDSFIVVDSYSAYFSAAEMLLEYGCEQIGYIGSSENLSMEPGYKACRDVMSGIRGRFRKDYMVSAGGYDFEKGKAAMDRLLLNEEYPDAVICCTDTLAAGAMNACRNSGLAVPEDISIIGTGDQDIAGIVEPALTSLKSPDEVIGLLCVNAVDDFIRGRLKGHENLRIRLDMQMINRSSVRTSAAEISENYWL